MHKEFSNAEIIRIFEDCWKELVNDYFINRPTNLYCSEGDVRLHFAHKLLEKLHFPTYVHVELPIPIDIEDFQLDFYISGRSKRKRKKGKCIVADVVVRNVDNVIPLVITEIKYYPFQWNLIPIMEAVEGKVSEETKERIKIDLQREISRFEPWEKYGPTQSDLKYFLGNVDKIIQVVRSFEEQENELVHAYLCVIDEIYPNLKQRLENEIEKYNPPNQFKLLVEHYPIRRWMEEQLKKL